MFLRLTIIDEWVSCEEVGLAIVRGNDQQQREILLAMSAAAEEMDLKGGSWAMQCRGIVDSAGGDDGLSAGERSRIAAMLSVLIDHLNEFSVDSGEG